MRRKPNPEWNNLRSRSAPHALAIPVFDGGGRAAQGGRSMTCLIVWPSHSWTALKKRRKGSPPSHPLLLSHTGPHDWLGLGLELVLRTGARSRARDRAGNWARTGPVPQPTVCEIRCSTVYCRDRTRI